MEEMELAIQAATSPMVQVWMNWMLIIFIASVIFVWKHKAARIVFASFVLTIPIALLIFDFSKNVHLIGIAHLLLWGPLAYYLFKFEIKDSKFQFKSVYGIWLLLLFSTVIISLVFDVRDVVLVFMGMK